MNQILLFLNNGSNISLILFFLILGFYLWYAFSIIYHLIRFGVGVRPKILALTFFIGSFVLFVMVIVAYSQVDWKGILQQLFNLTITKI